jgi:hypothetical protein
MKTSVGKKQVTETGLLLVLGCLIAGLQQGDRAWFIGALVVIMLTLATPWILYPLAHLWFGMSRILGHFVTKVLLTTLFVGLVLPFAYLRKALGWNALGIRSFKKGTASVFVDRDHVFELSDLQKPF